MAYFDFRDITQMFKLMFLFNFFGSLLVELRCFTSAFMSYLFPQVEAQSHEQVLLELDNLIFNNPNIVNFSIEGEFATFNSFCNNNGYALGAVLIPDRKVCRNCGKILKVNDPHTVVIYHIYRGSFLGTRISKTCSRCKITEYYGYYTQKGKRHFNNDCLELEYLLSTEETALDMKLLKNYECSLVIGAIPFSTYTDVFNKTFENEDRTEGESRSHKRLKGYVSEFSSYSYVTVNDSVNIVAHLTP